MELTMQLQVEEPETELIEFLGYEIPERFSVLFWISHQDYEDPFSVKLHYEIGEEGTPSVVETRISGSNYTLASENSAPDGENRLHSGLYYRGKVFRHHLTWTEKNFKDLFITGLQVAIQRDYKPEELKKGRFIHHSARRLNRQELKSFELQIREELASRRTLSPEFLKGVLRKREKYRLENGSHRGFNQRLADQEAVTIKAVEKWIQKAEKLPARAVKKTTKKKGK